MSFSKLRYPVLRLLLLTFLAVLVHGYHLGVDDAEIYVPAIKRAADPALYPFASEFFMSHGHMSFFPDLLGNFARFTRLPLDMDIFLWHVAGIFLLLLAAWRLLSACFESDTARWSGVALLAALLSVPVAGTALAIMDPYVTARSLSTPAIVFAIACYISGKPRQALLWLLAAALIHPQMSVYGAAFLGCLAICKTGSRLALGRQLAPAGMLSAFPFLLEFKPAQGAAREALFSRPYFFVSNWAWYEWIGIFAPLALLWWLSRANPRGVTPVFRSLARALVPFGLLFTVAGLAVGLPARMENFARLQPMRAFHIVYVVFFLLIGGLIGEYALKTSVWRWLALFVPLAGSMWLLQESSFPSSSHVEWPGLRSGNDYVSAFLWIRNNTPKDAVFAMDPKYMLQPGDDQHGFRAIAERSALAESIKDEGAASLFPQLADQWKKQVDAQSGWQNFRRTDFEKLAKRYPVTWILTAQPGPAGLVCPYESAKLAVCHLGGD